MQGLARAPRGLDSSSVVVRGCIALALSCALQACATEVATPLLEHEGLAREAADLGGLDDDVDSMSACVATKTLRIVSANLQHYSPLAHLDDLGPAIDEPTVAWDQVTHLHSYWDQRAVVYALQEVDRGGTGSLDWPDGRAWDRILARAFGPDAGWCGDRFATLYEPSAAHHMEPGGGATIGNAIVLGLAPRTVRKWDLATPEDTGACWHGWRRTAIAMEVGPAQWPVWVVNTHFPHHGDGVQADLFECVVQRLVDGLASFPDDAIVILAGDFNVGPNGPPEIVALWANLQTELAALRFKPVLGASVDHVFVRDPAFRTKIAESVIEEAMGTVDGELYRLSDHPWLTLDLELVPSRLAPMLNASVL